jgi:type VI secretion system secreted protein VgrG
MTMVRIPVQDNVAVKLSTPFGKDVLVLSRYDAREGISELFEYQIEAMSQKPDLDFDKAIGQHCSISHQVTETGGAAKTRYFDGILVEAQSIGERADLFAYRLVLRPWFWLAGRTADSEIFHNKTVREILEKTLSKPKLGTFRLDIDGTRKLPYCVRYRETQFAFASRIMEEHGLCYYFEHKAGDHTLVVADGPARHKPVAGSETLPVINAGNEWRYDLEHFRDWRKERRFRSGKVTFRDYDYMKPTANMEVSKPAVEKYTHADLEMYDYPGRYVEPGDGRELAKYRLESYQAGDKRRFTEGDAVTVYPGAVVTTTENTIKAENGQYLMVRATHAFSAASYVSGDADSQQYAGYYELQPADRPFRPAQITPKPTIYGPQTAVVVGSGEIDVDQEGRILVSFHWDRVSEKKQSCRVRVAQVWAGSDWGGVFIPRVGQEVLVQFLDGDIDQPLVVGAVYNGKHKQAFGAESNKTVNGFKTQSTTGGGGFNQLSFDDKKSSEKVYVRAEKELELLIRDREKRNIGEDAKNAVSRDTVIVKGDDKLDIQSGSQTVKASKEITLEALQKITLKVGQSTIVMDPTSITISAITVEIKASAQFKTSATMTDQSSSGPFVIKGLPVKIN